MVADGLNFGATSTTGPDDGLDFGGYPQPPGVPTDPTGENWRGPPGPPGPPGPVQVASTTVLGGIKVDGVTTSVSGSGVLVVIARLG